MNRYVGMLIFLSVFFIVVVSAHYYVLGRLTGLLGWHKGPAFWISVLLLSFSFIIANIVNSRLHNAVSRLFYGVTATWLGMMLIALTILAIFELFNLFLKYDRRLTAIVLIAIISIVTLYGLINARYVVVKEMELPIRGLDHEVRIVQWSDVHVGSLLNSGYLTDLVQKTNSVRPDAVLITGDLVDGSAPLWDLDLLPIKGLNAPAYFSTGNHERYEGLDRIMPLIDVAGLHALRNQVARVKGIQIIGIDDPLQEFEGPNADIASIDFDRDKPAVLMYHKPRGAEDAAQAGIDLQLSGHTHAGQIFPFNLLTRIAFKYVTGYHKVNEMHLYVSPGTGTWGPPMRLGSRSEITLIKLKPA